MTSEVVHGTLREDTAGRWYLETAGGRQYVARSLAGLAGKRVSISKHTTPDGRQSVTVQELVHDTN